MTKHRPLALLTTVLLLLSLFAAGCGSAPREMQVTTAQFSVTVPGEWADLAVIETDGNTDDPPADERVCAFLRVSEKTAHERGEGGLVFGLYLFTCPPDELTDYPSAEAVMSRNVSGYGHCTLVLIRPTDVQFSDDTAAAYRKLDDGLPAVLDSVFFLDDVAEQPEK